MTDQPSGAICSFWPSEQLLHCHQGWPENPAHFVQHLGLAVCLHKTNIRVSEVNAADACAKANDAMHTHAIMDRCAIPLGH